ncbi:MAG: hypothetical protein IPP74_01660 [Alphaproteobacteria bacterium]|nr:hypothetical protein [Alphaproteobacteria bacterium]
MWRGLEPLSIDISQGVFIPKNKYDLNYILAPNVCECVVAVIQGSKGTFAYHFFKMDKKKELYNQIKKYRKAIGNVEQCITLGGN